MISVADEVNSQTAVPLPSLFDVLDDSGDVLVCPDELWLHEAPEEFPFETIPVAGNELHNWGPQQGEVGVEQPQQVPGRGQTEELQLSEQAADSLVLDSLQLVQFIFVTPQTLRSLLG